MLTPAAPAFSNARTAYQALTALPKPVSPSAITGIATASAIRCVSVTISVMPRKP